MSKNEIPLKSRSLDSISLIEIIEHLNDKNTKLLLHLTTYQLGQYWN